MAVSPALRDVMSELMAMVGALPSSVELLVTEVLLSDAASLPWLSCTALASSDVDGSV